MVAVLQVNGTRGEITPLMHARMDTEFYQAGYAKARNTVITRYGPQTRVPGTLWFGQSALPGRKSKMLAFEFSEAQVYMLEFAHQVLRFWTPDGQVFSAGLPYQISTIYTEADLPYLHGRQSGDALYLFCAGKRPMILKRMSETNWVFDVYVPKDGPYLPINETDTTLTLGHTLNVVPLLTSNTTPVPNVVTNGTGLAEAYKIFARSKTADVQVSGDQSGYVQIDLGVDKAQVMDNYFIVAGSKNATTDAMFSQWDVMGSNNGVDWVTIDSRDNEKGWAGSETRYFETSNKTKFRYYRLEFSGGSGTDPEHDSTEMGGWYMHHAASDQIPTFLQASSIAGINGGEGFKATDVGRSVRLQGQDGRWRWAEIKEYESPTRVYVVVHGFSFLQRDPIQNWRLGAWSNTSGWPRTGRFYEDRMALAGWPSDPIGMALSVSAAYENFRTSSPLVDDDAITIRMTGGRLDTINWLSDVGTLVAGTVGGLRSIGSRDTASALKHDNIRQKLETSTAASRVQPVSVENVNLFMDRLQRRLYELGYSYEADGYLAREVSVLNDHLFEGGIERIEYVDAPYKFLVATRPDGKVVFFAYDREQKIAGGTLCDFGGFVEDILSMPGKDYPDLWMVVRRNRRGQTVRYIEKLAPFYNGRTAPNALPIYAACAMTYEGGAGEETNAVEGLDMLAGVEVGIWADGRDIGNATVARNGTVTLPQNIVAKRIVIGERMAWRLQSLPLPIVQNPQLGGLNSKLRVVTCAVDMFESARVRAGSVNQTEALRAEEDVEHDPEQPEPIRSMVFQVPVEDSFKNRGVFVIEGNSMFPATVRGVSLEVEMEP